MDEVCCRVRRYLLELPYQLMVTNTKADAHTTFKIPEDALVEVGMIYSVSFCVSSLQEWQGWRDMLDVP